MGEWGGFKLGVGALDFGINLAKNKGLLSGLGGLGGPGDAGGPGGAPPDVGSPSGTGPAPGPAEQPGPGGGAPGFPGASAVASAAGRTSSLLGGQALGAPAGPAKPLIHWDNNAYSPGEGAWRNDAGAIVPSWELGKYERAPDSPGVGGPGTAPVPAITPAPSILLGMTPPTPKAPKVPPLVGDYTDDQGVYHPAHREGTPTPRGGEPGPNTPINPGWPPAAARAGSRRRSAATSVQARPCSAEEAAATTQAGPMRRGIGIRVSGRPTRSLMIRPVPAAAAFGGFGKGDFGGDIAKQLVNKLPSYLVEQQAKAQKMSPTAPSGITASMQAAKPMGATGGNVDARTINVAPTINGVMSEEHAADRIAGVVAPMGWAGGAMAAGVPR